MTKSWRIPVICSVFLMSSLAYANDDVGQYDDVSEYEDNEVFDNIDDLIDEEFVEFVDVSSDDAQDFEHIDMSVQRGVTDRMSCDEINTKVSELREDVKSYPDLKDDLEYMLALQRSPCAPRAARRPVHNYMNVNPVVELQNEEEIVVEKTVEPEKTPEEIAAETAALEVERQAQIEENLAKGLCGDGSKPNKYGCCPGEVFKQLEHFDFACCPKDGDGDCHEPRKKA